MPKGLIVAACLVLAAGCAAQEDKRAEGAYKAPVYRTGSRIPSDPETAARSGEKRELSAEERRAFEETQSRSRRPLDAKK